MAQRKLTALRPQKPAPKKLRDPNEKNKCCVPRTPDQNSRTRKALYDRVSRKRGKAVARVAVARSMLRAIYYMLKYNKSFQERPVSNRPPVSAMGS